MAQGRALPDIRARFAELAGSLGADTGRADPPERLEEAGRRLREAAGGARGGGVLAVSGVDADKAYAARPGAWGDLAALAGCGVSMLEPPPGGGVNWTEVTWAQAAALEPGIVLLDARGNATGPEALRASADWRALEERASVVPWNPEAPLTHGAFGELADRLTEAYGPGGRPGGF